MRILIVIGTRPEAIKMLPLYLELKKISEFEVLLCNTGQHRELIKDVLKYFKATPDYSLDVMKKGQTLLEMSIKLLKNIDIILEKEKPDLVLVHGDTTSAFCAALSAFYKGIKIAHIEAGLRTFNKAAPYPEEFNRVAVDSIADLHFAPTFLASENLVKEGKKSVFTVGNTVIDALKYTLDDNYDFEKLEIKKDRKLLLITTHRRENLGEKMKNSLLGIRDILNLREDIFAVFPVHPNPQVREVVMEVFNNIKNIKICDPLPVYDFHNLLLRSFAVITDSGGIQEEAAYLGVPVFLLRDTTERSEGVKSGNIRLLGTKRERILSEFLSTINDEKSIMEMRKKSYSFGSGEASKKITQVIIDTFS